MLAQGLTFVDRMMMVPVPAAVFRMTAGGAEKIDECRNPCCHQGNPAGDHRYFLPVEMVTRFKIIHHVPGNPEKHQVQLEEGQHLQELQLRFLDKPFMGNMHVEVFQEVVIENNGKKHQQIFDKTMRKERFFSYNGA